MARQKPAIPQAAVLAFHEGQVCLITARSGRGWGVPKGRLEPGKSARDIALQEAWEEAGLVGFLHDEAAGHYDYEKAGNRYRVTVYFMEVTEIQKSWQEMHVRERKWAVLQVAARHVYQPGLQQLLNNLAESTALQAIRGSPSRAFDGIGCRSVVVAGRGVVRLDVR